MSDGQCTLGVKVRPQDSVLSVVIWFVVTLHLHHVMLILSCRREIRVWCMVIDLFTCMIISGDLMYMRQKFVVITSVKITLRLVT